MASEVFLFIFKHTLVFVELFDYTVMFFCRLFTGDANQKQIPVIFFQCIYIMLFFYLADCIDVFL